MATYLWEHPLWPRLTWDAGALLAPLAEARYRQGLFLGRMQGIGLDARREAELTTLADEAVKTSAIEGEVLNPASVRSSIARRLGIPDAGLAPTDRKVEGVVDIVMDAAKNHTAPLTAERIFGWHAALFPTGYSGKDRIDVGRWRSDRLGAMQVMSNVYSPTPTVHFEAPPAGRVADEMAIFLAWFNGTPPMDPLPMDPLPMDPLLRAGLAHLWFITIHPLDDGNGRIARAVADLAIAQAERTGQRFYSMSDAIERDKRRYYAILEATQKGGPDITGWLLWFTECYTNAIIMAETVANRVVRKARFWMAHEGAPAFSDRQRKVLGKLLDGFDGTLTTRKWAAICRCSADTALRDITDLVERGLLVRNEGGGKNTSFTFIDGQE